MIVIDDGWEFKIIGVRRRLNLIGWIFDVIILIRRAIPVVLPSTEFWFFPPPLVEEAPPGLRIKIQASIAIDAVYLVRSSFRALDLECFGHLARVVLALPLQCCWS